MEEKPESDQGILGELEEIGLQEEAAPFSAKKKKKGRVLIWILGAVAALIAALLIYWAISSHSSYSTPGYRSAISSARQEEANLKAILSSTSSANQELEKDLPDSSSVQAFNQTWNLANKMVSSLPAFITSAPKNPQEADSYSQSINQWVQQAKDYGYELTQQAQDAGIYGAKALFSTQKSNLEATLKKAGSKASPALASRARRLLGEAQPSSPSAMASMAEEMKSLSAQLAKE